LGCNLSLGKEEGLVVWGQIQWPIKKYERNPMRKTPCRKPQLENTGLGNLFQASVFPAVVVITTVTEHRFGKDDKL